MSIGKSMGKRTYVYQLLFPNHKKYIGITYNLNSRFSDHKKANGDTPLYRAIRKYGDSVVFSIVAICQTRYEAVRLMP
jgi:predicted GIY-YIG superfamily endonuclease